MPKLRISPALPALALIVHLSWHFTPYHGYSHSPHTILSIFPMVLTWRKKDLLAVRLPFWMFEKRNAFTCYVTWRKIERKCKTSLDKIIDTGLEDLFEGWRRRPRVEGGEARGGGEGLRRKEREGRECKRAEANEKQLTSFPCRGKNINTVIIIRCSNVHIIFTFVSRWWVGWGGIWRMKLEGKGGRNTRRGGNVNTNSKLITLNKSIQSIWGKLETKYKIS